jgi:hypothetical protein
MRIFDDVRNQGIPNLLAPLIRLEELPGEIHGEAA